MRQFDSQHRPAATVRLTELAGTVARRWLLVASSIAVVTGACLGAGTTVQKEYTAVASLAVSPLTTNPFSSAPVNQQINITTERAILHSNEVARIASKELGRDDLGPGALLKLTDVAAPSGSQVLDVSVTMPDPQEAADYANAMAAAYLKFRAEGAAEVASGYVAALDKEIAELTGVRNRTAQQAQRLSDAIQQRQSFILVADSPGRIIGVAGAPTDPSSLRQSTFLLAGLIGGLIVGIGAALLRERLDRKVRTWSRLSEACSRPALKVADQDDVDGMRWVLRSVRGPAVQAANGPLLISTMPVVGRRQILKDFADGLADAARAAGLSVLVLRPTDISLAMVDQGWPKSARGDWSGLDLVILETDHELRGARRAALADHLDAVVVLAFAGSDLQDLRRLESDLVDSKALRVPVLLGKQFSGEGATDQRKEGSLVTFPASAGSDQEVQERKEPA